MVCDLAPPESAVIACSSLLAVRNKRKLLLLHVMLLFGSRPL